LAEGAKNADLDDIV